MKPESIKLLSSPRCLTLLATVTVAVPAAAVPTAYVANAGSNDVSVIDTASNVEIARVAVGLRPFGVAVSPNNLFVYIANQDSNSVSIISTATNQVVKTLPVGQLPYGVVFTPDGLKAYVANNYSGTVTEIDGIAQQVNFDIPVGGDPWELAITPDGRKVYVTNPGEDFISVIDTVTYLVTEIPGSSFGVTISGNYGYFTVTGIAQLNVLDTTTDTWIATVQPVAVDPYDVSANADGTSVWVSGTRGSISVLDTRDPAHPVVTYTIELPNRGPREVAFHPQGTKAYVALSISNTVGVISIPDLQLMTEIPVGTTPQALDIALLEP